MREDDEFIKELVVRGTWDAEHYQPLLHKEVSRVAGGCSQNLISAAHELTSLNRCELSGLRQ